MVLLSRLVGGRQEVANHLKIDDKNARAIYYSILASYSLQDSPLMMNFSVRTSIDVALRTKAPGFRLQGAE